MDRFRLRLSFTICFALVGCSSLFTANRSPYLPAGLFVGNAATATSYKVIYAFPKSSDGQNPDAGLISVNGTLYGTTRNGGKAGGGTVFSLEPSGAETVLHSFGVTSSDGLHPAANLAERNGTLYGTTVDGGKSGRGTIFSITTSGTEKVLYAFPKTTDGRNPTAGLIYVNGLFYGTTQHGGTSSGSNGTVFSFTASGTEKVLHSFAGGQDGAWPAAPLLDRRGTFYGTTLYGGKYNGGTVFSITPGGTEKILHSFTSVGTSDGSHSQAGLVDLHGLLYGTTSGGGAYGYGTIFSVTTDGKEKVVHSFGKGSDGKIPDAGLIDAKGTLYGTTRAGGNYKSKGSPTGYGTIYELTSPATARVLHSFGHGSDGRNPEANLLDVGGTLYGTTYGGGSTKSAGTVFVLAP